jgi:hypothetical protein
MHTEKRNRITASGKKMTHHPAGKTMNHVATVLLTTQETKYNEAALIELTCTAMIWNKDPRNLYERNLADIILIWASI